MNHSLQPEPTHNARNATDPGPARAEPESLAQVRIVLVETQQPRNIGSTARAMKAMGLSKLVLVNPAKFPHKDANDLAAGADDVLQAAQVTTSLKDALVGCISVYGASARRRQIYLPECTPRAAAEAAIASLAPDFETDQNSAEIPEVAFVFGSEPAGLDNDAILQCQQLLQVPANPGFASLNLASAVQIVCYELRLAALAGSIYQPKHRPAAVEEFGSFFAHLMQTAEQADYFANKNVEVSSAQLLRIFQRCNATQLELRMLRGLLSQLQYRMRDKV